MENPIKMDDLGGKPTILGNIMASNQPGQVGAPDLFTSRGGKEGYYSGLGGRHRGAMGIETQPESNGHGFSTEIYCNRG